MDPRGGDPCVAQEIEERVSSSGLDFNTALIRRRGRGQRQRECHQRGYGFFFHLGNGGLGFSGGRRPMYEPPPQPGCKSETPHRSGKYPSPAEAEKDSME
jgi:hypothetical protein